MSKPTLSPVGLNAQVLGKWNPALFVPRWFADVGLLPTDEADSANIDIIHEEIAQFTLDWLTVVVTRDRFTASTTRTSHAEPLRDLVAGCLELLTHTPTRALGINHDYLLEFQTRADFDAQGWAVVPPDRWSFLSRPGVAVLQVQGERSDDRPGFIRVRMEPILDGSFRVGVGINDHYEVAAEDSSRNTPELASILQERWFAAATEAQTYVETVSMMGST